MTLPTSFSKKSMATRYPTFTPYSPLVFSEIEKTCHSFVQHIRKNIPEINNLLLKYESYEVVEDETNRALDLLENISENSKYFRLRIGEVASFLPRNQPLYALTCFVIIPSMMASKVCFRIPQSMSSFFPDLLKILKINSFFPNILVSTKSRIDFLKERSAIILSQDGKYIKPLTDVVIFTGTPVHADQLRNVFDRQTLFIANGAGHNPVVVSNDAPLSSAAEAVATLNFYNQGQDCAAPNAILVQKEILPEFLASLRNIIKNTKIGHYSDRTCRIGPISNIKDLLRIQEIFIENQRYLDTTTPGVIRTQDSIVEPTIILKPLAAGGNFNEVFAPVIFIQEYINDDDLKLYFENKNYAENAMYVTLYGTSKYVSNLIGRPINGKVLHSIESFIHNTHLHAPGVERGTQPYGGNGRGASSISIGNNIIAKATMPQRDIYENVAKKYLTKKHLRRASSNNKTKIQQKNVEKILRLKVIDTNNFSSLTNLSGPLYVDLHSYRVNNLRYKRIVPDDLHILLKEKNLEYIKSLKADDLKLVKKLLNLLKRKSKLSPAEFTALLYSIPKKVKNTKMQNIIEQRHFFEIVYQLLFDRNFGPQLGSFLWYLEDKDTDRLLRIRS